MSILDEQRELSRREKKRKKKREKLLIKFAIILVGILILAVFLSYVISDEVHMVESLIDKYNSLGQGLVTDSKEQFSKKLMFITVYTDDNGDLKLALGDNSVQTEGTGNEGSDDDDDNPPKPDSNLEYDPSNLFSDVDLKIGSKMSNLSVGNYDFYNGWPWSDNGNLTLVSFDAATNLMKADIAKTGGFSESDVRVRGWCVTSDYACKPVATVENIKCSGMTIHPGFMSKSWYSKAWSTTGVGGVFPSDKKACIVFKDSSGNYIYSPIFWSDGKRHTWPGGLWQTYVGHSDNSFEIANTMSNQSNNIIVPSGLTLSNAKGPNGRAQSGSSAGSSDGGLWSASAADMMRAFKNESCSDMFKIHYITSGGQCTNGTWGGLTPGFEVNTNNTSTLRNLCNTYTVIGFVIQNIDN